MTPEREDACLLLCPRPLTVQLIMSSPGAPPPPLSPDGATEGTVRAKEHRCVMLAGSSRGHLPHVPREHLRWDIPVYPFHSTDTS